MVSKNTEITVINADYSEKTLENIKLKKIIKSPFNNYAVVFYIGKWIDRECESEDTPSYDFIGFQLP